MKPYVLFLQHYLKQNQFNLLEVFFVSSDCPVYITSYPLEKLWKKYNMFNKLKGTSFDPFYQYFIGVMKLVSQSRF